MYANANEAFEFEAQLYIFFEILFQVKLCYYINIHFVDAHYLLMFFIAIFQISYDNAHLILFLFLMLISQELARDRLMMELAREQRISNDGSKNGVGKAISLNSAAVGASLGAGLGFVLAIVMGAASALRKP